MTCYNDTFSDEDVARLCQVAAYANNPQYRPYVCFWVTNGVVCNSDFLASEFPEHLRSAHGIVGTDTALVMCCWVNCFTEMNKESLMRHVNETHLESRYVCPTCNEQFTRTYTMQMHMARRHLGN